MSTPVDLNITMPYGVTVVGDGTNNPKLAAPHPKQMQNFGLKLPPGPCRIAASWEGDEKVGVVVQTSGTRNYRTVGNIPEKSGGVHVKGCSPSGRSKTTTCTSTGTSSRRARRALSRFTRSTSKRSSGRGGGVGDHPEHGLRCAAHNHQLRGRNHWWNRHAGKRWLPQVAGRRVHGDLLGPRHEHDRAPQQRHDIVGPIREIRGGRRAIQGGVQRLGPEGSGALYRDACRQGGRRGRDYHHLPAGLVAQGVAA